MAGWYRRDLADDARLRMLLELGEVELAKAYLDSLDTRVRNEQDDAPGLDADTVERLRRFKLWRTLEELIGAQMANRARANRARARNATSRDVTLRNATSREVTATRHNTTQHERETLSDETPKPPPLATEPKAEKPSRKAPAVRIPLTWAPNDAHRATARDRRLNLDWQAERFRDHAETNDRRCANWDAAFRNWLAKADPSREPRAPMGPRPTAATLTTVGIPEFRRATP